MSENTLKVCEIFSSIQGESSFAGLPCAFVRLAGCALNCRWCDTAYARRESSEMTLDEIAAVVRGFGQPLVEITGGEPLEQAASIDLMKMFLGDGLEVLLETNGAKDISKVPSGVRRIMDIKCPSSGMAGRMLWSNFSYITSGDEVKFVVAGREDFAYALKVIEQYHLVQRCPVLLAPVWGELEPAHLAGWILESALPLRLQIQMHKIIWGMEARGV